MNAEFIDDIHSPGSWAQRVRPEGRVHEMSWTERAGYLWKYLVSPRFHAPDAMVQHFMEQKRLQAYLRFQLAALPGPSAARIAFAGDLMWIRSHWSSFLSAPALQRLREFDGIIANLETIISPRFPVMELLPDILRFNSYQSLVTSFRDQRGRSLFAALGLANNHSLDLGDEGLLDTLDFLGDQGIATSGVSREKKRPHWARFHRGGISFGFFSACFGMNNPSLLPRTQLHINVVPGLAPEYEEVDPDLSAARIALEEMRKAKIDVKIIYLHWGSEFEFYPTAKMMSVARALVSAGADFVVGSHPHVPQPMEMLFVNGYEKRFSTPATKALPALQPKGNSLVRSENSAPRMACVLYSMGNFTTNMYTFFCRAALLAGVQFFREESTGTVRWGVPSLSYFYNQPPRWNAGRSLLPLEEHLRLHQNSSAQQKATFLQGHLALQEEQELARLKELPWP